MDKIVIDSAAVAYHYMIHTFKVNRDAKFNDGNFRNFVEDFELYANENNFELVNKEGKTLKYFDICDEISANYVEHSKDVFGDNFSHFSVDAIETMRKAYQNSSYDYKSMVFKFEEMLARTLYQSPSNYLLVEKYYKMDAKKYKKADDEKIMA